MGCLKKKWKNTPEKEMNDKIDNIIREFEDHALTKSYSPHIPLQKCKELGPKIEPMEDNQKLQDAVLTLHHITMRTLTDTPILKIVENHVRKAYIYSNYQSGYRESQNFRNLLESSEWETILHLTIWRTEII
jgi:hypothetical protein